ncbi:MAG: LLM class flavin-dependent oxidoreductase, partial [Terriglobales bacterium]
GARYHKTITAMREYVTIVRRILAGECVTLEGEIFRVKNFQLNLPPADPPIPIYLAAIGPKMIQLAGEVADGMLGFFYSIPYLKNVVLPNLHAGAKRSGRSLEKFDLGVGMPALVTKDDRGLEQVKGTVLMFATARGSSAFFSESISQAGFAAQGEEIQERVARKDMKGALQVVSDEMAAALTLAGSEQRVLERVRAYREAGANSVVLNPFPPDTYFPLFQGHFPEGAECPPFSFPAFLEAINSAIEFVGSAAEAPPRPYLPGS